MSAFLKEKTAIITGGGGMLGREHAAALALAGARIVLLDVDEAGLERNVRGLRDGLGVETLAERADVTDEARVREVIGAILRRFGSIDILVNNAARNPVVDETRRSLTRLESLDLDDWRRDLEVGLTGALVCSRVCGKPMVEARSGVILNIASDLSVIAPDQRIYEVEGLPADQQPVKPVSYSVVKTGLVGLTRYLATYWAPYGIRVNSLSPGGVQSGQPERFVERVVQRIPLGRMARADEYRAAVVFLCSDASSYMTGQNLVMDGGRSCW